jgi:hypothetical protein
MWKEFDYEHLLKTPPPKIPCFLAGTLIKTNKGLLPIEQIKAGNQVYAFNFETQKTVLKTVTECFESSCDKYLEIHTQTDIIKATGAHRFWIASKNNWVKARDLTSAMSLQDVDGNSVEIIDLIIIDQVEKTYNFEVEDLHNYFVGKNQILSHNQKSLSKSIFASSEIIEVNFYKILDPKMEAIYAGQTIQPVDTRYSQHRRDPKKAAWVNKMRGIFELEIGNIPGPYKMTPYEAAVVELYEINYNKGTTKSIEGFKNKSKPIGKTKFNHFKTNSNFNPCIFYA